MDSIGVLLIDDHRVVRQGLRDFLELQDDIEVVGEAASGEEGVKLAQELLPDVVLMDPLGPPDRAIPKEATLRLGQMQVVCCREDREPIINREALTASFDNGPIGEPQASN